MLLSIFSKLSKIFHGSLEASNTSETSLFGANFLGCFDLGSKRRKRHARWSEIHRLGVVQTANDRTKRSSLSSILLPSVMRNLSRSFGNRLNVIKAISLVAFTLVFSSTAVAQVTTPPNINGAFAIGQNNLAGTADNTDTPAMLTGLGEQNGVTFDFDASLTGTGLWLSLIHI